METTAPVPALVVYGTVATSNTALAVDFKALGVWHTALNAAPGLGSLAAPGAICPTRARAQTARKENMAGGGVKGRALIAERGSIIRVMGLLTQTAAAHVVRESTTPTSDHYQREPVPHATQENTIRILVVAATALAKIALLGRRGLYGALEDVSSVAQASTTTKKADPIASVAALVLTTTSSAKKQQETVSDAHLENIAVPVQQQTSAHALTVA